MGYGILRMSKHQEWKPVFLLQPMFNALLALFFEWGVGLHDVEMEQVLAGKVSRAEFRKRFRPFAKKARRQILKDYVLFPRRGPARNWPRSWPLPATRATANMVRNLWSLRHHLLRPLPG